MKINDEDCRPLKKNGSSYGYAIQSDLSQLLSKSTPFVKTESSILRFDVAAYIPKDQRIGFHEDIQIACPKKFNRNHCRLMWQAIRDEAKVPNEQYYAECEEARKKAEAEGKGTWRVTESITQYRLGVQGWKWDEPDMWNSVKEECRCYNDEDCPTLVETREAATKEAEKGVFLDGLHLFEIKSDMDVEHRLTHQLPGMYGLADYAWLVLGENREIPPWVPPWIGILWYNEEDHSFEIDRKARLTKSLPAMHGRWLMAHGVAESLEPHDLQTLFYKWCINSMFGWGNNVIVLDMTPELTKLCKVSKWGKRVDVALMQEKLLSIEEYGPDGADGR